MIRSFKLSTDEMLHVSLLSDIADSLELKKQLLDHTLECCCISPSLILDCFQIAVAADKASIARSRNKLVTKSIYTEILYNLSISKHISKSLSRFGVQENDRQVLVAVVGSLDDLKKEISKIKGNQTNLEQLYAIVDKEAINKEYNIKEEEAKKISQLDSIITRISTKNL